MLICAVLLTSCGDDPRPGAAGPVLSLPMGLARNGGSELIEMTGAALAGEMAAALEQETAISVTRVQAADVDMLLFVAALDHFEPAIVGLTSHHGNGVTPLNALAAGGLELVIGSGFVAELYALAPVGLLKIDGVLINGIQRHGYTRVLGVREHSLGVVSHREFEQGLFDSAIQVGPGIIEGGQLDISERDLERVPYHRAVVGACGDKALFGITMIPMHLYTLGQAVLDFVGSRGLPCDELVNLAGDREAVLAVRREDGSMLYVGNPRTSKVALVGLRRREKL